MGKRLRPANLTKEEIRAALERVRARAPGGWFSAADVRERSAVLHALVLTGFLRSSSVVRNVTNYRLTEVERD